MHNSRNSVLLVILAIFTFSCRKELAVPQDISYSRSATDNSPFSLQASATSVVLLDKNADSTVLSLRWEAFHSLLSESQHYTIEAAMAGPRFINWVEIGSSGDTAIEFTTREFNKQIRQLFVAGLSEDVMMRVRLNRENLEPLYSYGILLQVTTYQPTITYDESYGFRIPGNFQNWKPELAPRIVSPKLNGEYEGYINFTNEHSQFLMIKDMCTWSASNTYYYIGSNKFGFGGTIFSVPGGAGVYKFNASTNTNTWNCTKINVWSMSGTAIAANGDSEVDMRFNEYNNSWEITRNFAQGSFIFRANKANDIVFGHNNTSEIGIPDYNGAKIEITAAGNYTVNLFLLNAGNYSYSVERNP